MWVQRMMKKPTRVNKNSKQHRQLLEAIKKGNKNKIRKLTSSHVKIKRKENK